MHQSEREFFRKPNLVSYRRRLWIFALVFGRHLWAAQTLELGGAQDELQGHSALYVWSTNTMTYAGRTSLIREDARQDLRLRSGPITRLMEHYQHTHNLQSREAPRVRYKLARCSEADLHAFFIPRIGKTKEINHMETFSINRFAPNGNGKR